MATATPCPKNGVAGPPHFWPRGGWPPHTGRMGVTKATPRPLGVVQPPQKAKKKKKKKDRAMGLGFWGWLDHPQGPEGGFGHPLPAVGGGQSHAQALEGWSGHPQRPNPFFRFFFFFFFFFVAIRGGWTTPKGRPPRFLPLSFFF
jgi:hypothetical protein